MIEMHFDELPSMLRQFPRAVLPKSGLRGDEALPRMEATCRGVTADPQKLAVYRRLCAIPTQGQLPATFVQILATPLHMAILTHQDFPLSPLGLVHVGNTIVEHEAIADDARIDFRCFTDAQRPARQGIEFDILTEARVEGALVWQAVMTVLARTPKPKGNGVERPAADTTSAAPELQPPAADRTPDRSVSVRVPENMGRRYAAVAGDYNPIHLHAASARLFGFKRAIVHGMWSLARVLGEVSDDLPPRPRRLEVRFKRPVFLPSTVLIQSYTDENQVLRFAMKTADGQKDHLFGQMVAMEP